jgi:prepilin-type N-terminal cleavage/methylation domain-containing protein/prepilin-type processing-associated H-X9-DG protein
MNGHDLQTGPAVRRGFTIVEFIVALVIIGLLAALLIPNIQNARTPARRTQCQSNLRNVGLAVQAYATAHRGAVPPLTGGLNLDSSGAESGRSPQPAPWSVHLLPYLEQQALYDRLLVRRVEKSGDLSMTAIESFICPDHPTPNGNGTLSYVANAGMMASELWNSADDREHRAEIYDYGFNGYSEPTTDLDRNVAYATGVFWRYGASAANASRPTAMTLDFISRHDGTSQTVILSENRDTRPRDPKANSGGWYSDATGDIAFGIPVAGQRVGTRFEAAWCDQPDGVGTAGGESAALTLAQNLSSAAAINSPDGSGRPRPSSNHPGIVNMAFADGSCKVISERISLDVYVRLLSPGGNRHGQKWLSSSDF